MSRTSIATATTFALLGADAALVPASAQVAYELPSPSSAVYQVADTSEIVVDSPAGLLEVASASATTLTLSFRRDGGRLQVSGTIDAFAGSVSDPMSGSTSVDESATAGILELELGRTGIGQVVSVPRLVGGGGQLNPFRFMPYQLFPRLPGDDVQPGDTWADTVVWSSSGPGPRDRITTIYGYTVAGDEVIDDRKLTRIAVSGTIDSRTSSDQGGLPLTHELAGTIAGFLLWDPDRGLVAAAELQRDMNGTTSGAGLGEFPLSLSGTVRVQLEG